MLSPTAVLTNISYMFALELNMRWQIHCVHVLLLQWFSNHNWVRTLTADTGTRVIHYAKFDTILNCLNLYGSSKLKIISEALPHLHNHLIIGSTVKWKTIVCVVFFLLSLSSWNNSSSYPIQHLLILHHFHCG